MKDQLAFSFDESVLGENLEKDLNKDNLSSLTSLVNRLIEIEKLQEDLENQLKQLSKEKEILSSSSIPGFLQELGLSKITLESGQEVKIKPEIRAAIIADKKDEAFSWLRENGHSDMIKEVHKFEVNWATLGKWVREMRESGQNIPKEFFAVYDFNKTIIK